MNKTKLLLFLPIIVLLVWTLSVHSAVMSGTRVRIPVRGFDPRDILAGQYLAINTDYSGFSSECPQQQKDEKGRIINREDYYRRRDAYFCAEAGKIVLNRPADCSVFIKGQCVYGRFDDGISRFYIPESRAGLLEKAVRQTDNMPELELSVAEDGKAYPVDLILNGMPWKKWAAQNDL